MNTYQAMPIKIDESVENKCLFATLTPGKLPIEIQFTFELIYIVNAIHLRAYKETSNPFAQCMLVHAN